MSNDHASRNGSTTPVASPKSVFLADPFKTLLTPEAGQLRSFERCRYEVLTDHLKSSGYTVHKAHKREGRCADFLQPEDCTRMDYEQIRDYSVFVAFPSDPASLGTDASFGAAELTPRTNHQPQPATR